MDGNFLEIRGNNYKVEPVSKIYFRGLTECLADLGDVDYLSKSAKTIKKVIIPTIPDTIICKGDLDEEFYLWHSSVEPEEINDIILKIARCFRLQKIEQAREKGDEAAIKEHEEGLVLINQYLKSDVDIKFEEVKTYPEDSDNEDAETIEKYRFGSSQQDEIEKLRAELKVLKQQGN
jgi:hypothetical protein